MDRNARLKEVVRAAKEHPVYREKFKGVHPEEVTLENLGSFPSPPARNGWPTLRKTPGPQKGQASCT